MTCRKFENKLHYRSYINKILDYNYAEYLVEENYYFKQSF